ncbi:MAG: hypothetical protein ACYTGV_15790 [Planctomycetota bacterium]
MKPTAEHASARGDVGDGTTEWGLCDVDGDRSCRVLDALKIARGEPREHRCLVEQGADCGPAI